MFSRRQPKCVGTTHIKMAMAVRTSIEEDREPGLHETEGEIASLEHTIPTLLPLTSRSYRYKGVYVLIFLWQDDDLNVKNEVKELKDVFERYYRFTVAISVIPSRRPYHHVKNEIEKLHNVLSRNDCLVIVYYSGHGHLFGYGKMTWSAYE
jgi:hypothetical protein